MLETTPSVVDPSQRIVKIESSTGADDVPTTSW